MDRAGALNRLHETSFAVLGTVEPSGAPHVVPIVFAVIGERLVTAVDHKPKRTRKLQRLVNIAHEPRVTVLAHHDDSDWSRLWWVRVDGTATVVETPAPETAQALLDRYHQYGEHPPSGPWIVVQIERVSGWASSRDT